MRESCRANRAPQTAQHAQRAQAGPGARGIATTRPCSSPRDLPARHPGGPSAANRSHGRSRHTSAGAAAREGRAPRAARPVGARAIPTPPPRQRSGESLIERERPGAGAAIAYARRSRAPPRDPRRARARRAARALEPRSRAAGLVLAQREALTARASDRADLEPVTREIVQRTRTFHGRTRAPDLLANEALLAPRRRPRDKARGTPQHAPRASSVS